MNKLDLSICYNSDGWLKIYINNVPYVWHNVSMQVSEWIDWDVKHGRNKGRIIEHLEKEYGKGVKEKERK